MIRTQNAGFCALTLTFAAAIFLSACQSESGTDALLAADARDTEIVRTADTVVARVEGTAIYQSDVERAAAGQGLIADGVPLANSDPIFRTTLEELVDQRLLALDAARAGLAQEDEARRRLAAARERILGNLRVETHLAEQVNERTIRELYEAQKQLANRGEERRVRQIVLADEDAALAMADRLSDEEDFETLAGQFSIDEATRVTGGELGWVSRDMLAGPLRLAVFQTPVGGRSEPVYTADGWYIMEVLDRRNPAPRTFEETRDEIARFMTFDAIQSLITELRDGAEIEFLFDGASQEEADAASESEGQTETQPEE